MLAKGKALITIWLTTSAVLWPFTKVAGKNRVEEKKVRKSNGPQNKIFLQYIPWLSQSWLTLHVYWILIQEEDFLLIMNQKTRKTYREIKITLVYLSSILLFLGNIICSTRINLNIIATNDNDPYYHNWVSMFWHTRTLTYFIGLYFKSSIK